MNLVGLIKLNEEDGEQPIIDIAKVDLDLNAIGKTPKDTWIPVSFVKLDLQKMKLKTSAGHMISLIDIFECNVDEPSDFLKSTRKYWKKIEFEVDLSSGQLNLG
jgi:hypothetical protein